MDILIQKVDHVIDDAPGLWTPNGGPGGSGSGGQGEQQEFDRGVTQHRGPWHPHESPWEEKLYKSLVDAGLKPRPQFPVSSRRLDLALVQEGIKPLKIDIEVDGDCHRNSDGTRKIDDLWRDLQLQGLGWKVMRFWTYQLREDMVGCVDKIRQEWSGHERSGA